MPWKEMTVVSSRREFVVLASKPDRNMTRLCERFGISRKTGYKWLRRYHRDGVDGLEDRSRRPDCSPEGTPEATTQAIVTVRDEHPAWGPLKLRKVLLNIGYADDELPSPRTFANVLRRTGRIDPQHSARHRPWTRFEHDAANRLWQMDFKGNFPTRTGRCHPLSVLDDHSRYALGLWACPNEQGTTVQARLTAVFGVYGLPERILVDHGSPWGSDTEHVYTPLTVWLLRLGVAVSHGAAYHPQTRGKVERFHRTLKAEVLSGADFRGIEDSQEAFDQWRNTYNLVRPHEALGQEVPASRYEPSPKVFPKELPPIVYGPNDIVRKVQGQGEVYYGGREYRIPKAFRGYRVGLRPTAEDGVFAVYFSRHKVAQIDLRVHHGKP
jgi:transposase InsO family protein